VAGRAPTQTRATLQAKRSLCLKEKPSKKPKQVMVVQSDEIDYNVFAQMEQAMSWVRGKALAQRERLVKRNEDHRLTSTQSNKDRLQMSALKPESDTIGQKEPSHKEDRHGRSPK